MFLQKLEYEDTAQTGCWTLESWAGLTNQPAGPSGKLVQSTGRPAKPGQTENGCDYATNRTKSIV